MNESKIVYLVDVSGYIFRAYHAIRGGLTTASGLPTNAVYGFTQMLIKLIKDEQPSHLVPVFDVSRISFRQDLYPAYKANRPDPPEDLAPQFPLVREVVRAFRLPPVEKEGFEADDVIGTLCKLLTKEGHQVKVVTSDKDMMQLVNDSVSLLDTWKNKRISFAEVEKRFGVSPDKVIDVLGLAGDTSDNVPGVPGVGEKTASSLIQQFGSVEAVLENIDAISGKKRKENLTEFADQARLSKQLVTIRTDVPLDFNLDNYLVQAPDPELATELFERLEFSSLLQAFELATPKKTLETDNYILVDDETKLHKMVQYFEKQSLIAFDTETNTTDTLADSPLVGLSFSVEKGNTYYVPVAHSLPNVKQVNKNQALQSLTNLFADPDKTWIMQNAKFDIEIMRTEGVEFAGTVEDTMLLSYVLNPARRGHGLDALAQEWLNHQMISYQQVAGKGKDQVTFDQVDTKTACRYSGEDADATARLFGLLSKQVKEAKLWSLYEDIERPLVTVLAKMERTGVLVDKQALEKLTNEFDHLIAGMETEIYDLAGETFNINSTQQLGVILFERLGLPKGRKTKTGYSTDSTVLEKLAGKHPLPRLILDYRQAAKLRSTYTDALVKLINPKTGRIHSSFNQTVAMTGRLSSSDPNLQNIPVRTESGRMIRRAFIPQPGFTMLSADYSQIELRILAHLSKDEILLRSFNHDEDVHTRTAAEVFDTMAPMVDREMRRRAKAVNFGIVYGQSPYGLSESLGIPLREAKTIIDNYFERYSGVKDYIEEHQQQARKEKVVQTLFGRRIPLLDIDSSNASQRAYAERVAINAPIQGSAADIIKIAMLRIDSELSRQKLQSRMLMQVHDELIFEILENELESMKELVVREMMQAAQLDVPLKVDVGLGNNWDEAH